jgi:ABC-2 type transport system ATP-binding protein
MNAIQTSHLTKYYGKARGITDISLSVREGAFFGFIGPNGAGKSTLIRTLLGLITPTSGTATVFGNNTSAARNELLKSIGYLPSETHFYDGMTVANTIAFSARLRGLDCTAEAKLLCDRLDLDPTKKVDALSLGNRKKVGIVCALQHRPRLYVLDEPTSGLDPLVKKEFYSILEERNAEGATVFLSSHVLSEIERYCTDAAIIREGRLLVSDSVQNLSHTGVKRVTLRGAQGLPDIPQIRNVRTEGDSVSFLYEGASTALLSILSTLAPNDFNVSDPDLDEIFLHYYEKEDR